METGEDVLDLKKEKTTLYGWFLAIKKAIDGARTRGLDLGKVARYQLRHYRKFPLFDSAYHNMVKYICQGNLKKLIISKP